MCAALVACKKEPATQPSPTPGSAATVVPLDASSVSVDAPSVGAATVAPLVDLLRRAPGTTLRVSSRVRNKTIKPEHIFDGNLNTAWNSVTGELAGAWVQIEAETDSHIVEVRMTVGHTGKGKKGEDYFTMNPRITKLKVIRAGKPDTVVELDPERRDLQTVAIDGHGTARIEVVAVKPGTKKAWREVAISELEAWGHRAASAPPLASPAKPAVAVGEIPDATDTTPCSRLAQEREEREASRKEQDEACAELPTQEERDQCAVDPPGDPECDDTPVTIEQLAPPWKSAAITCWSNDNVYGPVNCTVRVSTTTASVAAVEIGLESAKATAEVTNAIVNKGGALEIQYETDEYGTTTAYTVVCNATPALACGAPVPDKK